MSITSNEQQQAEISRVLDSFNSIGLKEMDNIRLLNRFDSKYIFHLSALPWLLQHVSGSYQVLQVAGLNISQYKNLYFDTAELRCFLDHQRGKASRFKVRYRTYTDTGKCFFEVKVKTNKGRTQKFRTESEREYTEIPAPHLSFLNEHFQGCNEPFLPQLANEFSRITLVNPERCERVTLDVFTGFHNGEEHQELRSLVVAEVKQKSVHEFSAFKELMESERIFPYSISKYCIGILLTKPGVKYNRFKHKLITINNLSNGVA